MPLVAVDTNSGKRIDITTYANPRKQLAGTHLVCPRCNANMSIIAGFRRVNHFRHKVGCHSGSGYEYHPESAEHLQAKAYLAQKLRAELNELGDSENQVMVELEVRIDEVRRIADIMVTYPMGFRLAHEIQLYRTNPKELEARTDDYLRAGIDVVWWFGKNNETPENISWSKERFGCWNYIDFNDLQVEGDDAITDSLER